ncbi:22116_t:CDS:2 [Entrophospora sp. SA101]|nr:22116_t:CDS:2 [Entrophospora sp. SA101]
MNKPFNQDILWTEIMIKNPFRFWKSVKKASPNLSMPAICLLSLPVASAGAERFWSVMASIHTLKLNEVSQDEVEENSIDDINELDQDITEEILNDLLDKAMRKFKIMEINEISINILIGKGFYVPSLIGDMFFLQFIDIINNRLEEIFKKTPNGKFSDYERKKEVEEIWNLLRNNMLSKHNIEPVVEQIDKEVKEIFSRLPSVGLYQKYINGKSPDLSKCNAYKHFKLFSPFSHSSQCLELRDIRTLQEKLDNLVDSILEERASYHYYPRIVHDLTKEIDNALNYNSKYFHITFLPDFKWNTYLYALLKLQYGHTLVSEGHIIGDYLLRVIHKKAMDAGNSERKKAVCDIVRLKYFEKLAEQVQNGDKEEAIQFFSQPKKCIEDWFKRTVDGIASGNPEQKYNDTFREIKKFVNDYMTQVDKVDYKLDLEDINDEDLNIFYNAIEEELDTKRDGCYTRNEPFQAPSNDKSIMEILGCTEACYFCGALCWGSLGHHNDSGETKRHHTSHQPQGLGITKYISTGELVAEPCHKTSDDTGVRYFGKEDLTPWSVAKIQDFSHWIFEPHYKYLFNDLMCWFFEKLHKDLAKKDGLKPSTNEELKKNGCLNLSYNDIISTLRTKIY